MYAFASQYPSRRPSHITNIRTTYNYIYIQQTYKHTNIQQTYNIHVDHHKHTTYNYIVVVTCTLYLPVCPGELGSVVWLQMGGRRRALHQHQSGPEPHARLSVPAHTPDNRAVLVTYLIYVYMYNYVCIPWWGHKMVL